MGQHLASGGLLRRSQFALKTHIQWLARETLVANAGLDTQIGKQGPRRRNRDHSHPDQKDATESLHPLRAETVDSGTQRT
jgi:hypothetical protein